MKARIQELLSQMTLEEKVKLTIGDGFWRTSGVERLGVPGIAMNDGPNGLRKPYQDTQTKVVPATCFPSSATMASSWDTTLVEEVGQALAEECLANDVQVLLGPGVNIKRTPLGGRNFEYYSEDPMLAGEMGCAFVRGVQSKGVGTSLKHFACNNQEFERMTISAEVDERTLHELYLRAFEYIVKKAQPWTVMAAYNKVNGIYASEHPELLRDILKTEWGYDGLVVSDWGAVNNKVNALKASLDLEMPGLDSNQPARIVQHVRDGELAEATIDEAAFRVLRLLHLGLEHRQPDATFDPDQHHALARRAASEGIVLLKNEHDLLPVQSDKVRSIAILGRFAKYSRYQGGGSAKVNPIKTDNAYDELRLLLDEGITLSYADGYTEDGKLDEAILHEAVELARGADLTIIFAGLTDRDETEGVDRRHLDLSEGHNRLIEEVCRAQPKTVVVLSNGSAITMPWINEVPAVLEAGLDGQAVGGAIADVLVGKVNPSGKLAETFARQLEDTPAYLNYPGEAGQVRYGEGIFVGYRYFERKKIQPLFPFGYGLSYTTFAHTALKVSQSTLSPEESLEITVTVQNTGTRAGKEIVQVYVRDIEASVARPEKELKAFAKVALAPGESQDMYLRLKSDDFAFYDVQTKRWRVEAGEFEILIGKSSAEITLRERITVDAPQEVPIFSKWQTLRQYFAHPQAAAILMGIFASMSDTASEEETDLEVVFSMPLIKLAAFGIFTEEQIDALVEQVNHAVQTQMS